MRFITPRLLTTLVASILVLGFAVGCGDDPDDPQEGSPYDDLDDHEITLQVIQDAMCEAAFECAETSRSSAQSFVSYSRYGSVEDCKADANLFGEAAPAEFEAGVSSNRVSIDRSAADDCRQAFRDQLCDGGLQDSTPSACNQLFQGNVEEDGNCVDTTECEGDLRCTHESDDEGCYGTCQEPEENDSNDCGGEECADDEYCDSFFDPVDDELVESCEPIGDEGDECERDSDCDDHLICSASEGTCQSIEFVDDGDDCFAFGPQICDAGLSCFAEDMFEPGTCGEVGDEGSECQLTANCEPGLFCEIGAEEDSGECAPLKSVGESCEGDTECETLECDATFDEPGECLSGEDAMCVHPDD